MELVEPVHRYLAPVDRTDLNGASSPEKPLNLSAKKRFPDPPQSFMISPQVVDNFLPWRERIPGWAEENHPERAREALQRRSHDRSHDRQLRTRSRH